MLQFSILTVYSSQTKFSRVPHKKNQCDSEFNDMSLINAFLLHKFTDIPTTGTD